MTAAVAVVDVRDLRVAGGLMLGAAATQALWASSVGGPPCPLRTLTGVPCPLCGMTTSVCATVALDLGAAVAANPFGPVAVVVAAVLLARRSITTVRFPLCLPFAALAASWGWQLVRFSEGAP